MNTSFKKRKTGKFNSGNKSAHTPPRGKFRGNSGRSRAPKKAAKLDPSLLVRAASEEVKTPYVAKRTFPEMPLRNDLQNSLVKKGFTAPSEIQDKTLETILEGRDLLGIAQTGTGKTGAFLIPMIQQMLETGQKPFALVVVPTRELANQVEDEFRSMTKGLKLYSASFIGGTSVGKDIQTLRRPSHLVIGTPGRLIDLLNRRVLDLRTFNTLVLDEFDRMLDMGFVHDVKTLIAAMRNRNQTLLFSATMDRKQESIIRDILTDPVTVKVSSGTSTGDHIDQDVVHLGPGEDKFRVLLDMVNNQDFEKVLVFDETKRRVSRLCEKLNKSGVRADEIHGDKSQNARQRALNSFKRGRVQVLVATDVAARGIDVSDVTHVINYQLPTNFDSYIHRIGRTGRAGKTGKAFTFVD